MPRLKKKTGHLRGSVSQNRPTARGRKPSRFASVALRLGILSAALCVIAGFATWSWHNGWPQRQTERLADSTLELTQKAKFAVRDLVVEGRKHTDKAELYAALGTTTGAAILAFDPAEASARVSKLPWVAGVTIERLLPDVILVKLTERVPIARWQHDGKVMVIDREGTPLPDARPEQFAQLPMVIGDGAPPEAQRLLDALGDFPAVTRMMTSAVHVSGRRWNLYLQPHILIKLPEQNLGAALYRLAALIRDQKILERDIVALDLRLPDRLIFEPAATTSPAARAKEPSL